MEIVIDLKQDCFHDKRLSYYNHNYYTLKTPLFDCTAIKVVFDEPSEQSVVTFGDIKEAFYGVVNFDGYQSTKGILRVYLD